MFLFTALLFYLLTPGILLTLPSGSSKNVVAITHSIVFALIMTLTHKMVWEWGVANGWIVPKKHKYSSY
jgi:hypothetical protein